MLHFQDSEIIFIIFIVFVVLINVKGKVGMVLEYLNAVTQNFLKFFCRLLDYACVRYYIYNALFAVFNSLFKGNFKTAQCFPLPVGIFSSSTDEPFCASSYA